MLKPELFPVSPLAFKWDSLDLLWESASGITYRRPCELNTRVKWTPCTQQRSSILTVPFIIGFSWRFTSQKGFLWLQKGKSLDTTVTLPCWVGRTPLGSMGRKLDLERQGGTWITAQFLHPNEIKIQILHGPVKTDTFSEVLHLFV